MSDLSSSSLRLNTNRPTAAALAAFALTLIGGGRAYAQDSADPKAAPAEAPAPKAAPVEATEGKSAAPAEAKPVEASPPPAAPAEAPPAAPVAPPVEWKVQSKAGFLMTSGNSQSTNMTVGLNGSRKEGNNKLALEGGMAYGRSKNLVAKFDDPANPSAITSLDRNSVVSTNNWAAKGRYDRFLTENNTAYVSGLSAADKIAGKTFFGGGQTGYSRQVIKDKLNLVVAELGYDFSYERYVQQTGKTADPVSIHSARILVGETLSLNAATGLTASVEALLNLNTETKAKNVKDGSDGVAAFKDTRINTKLGITTNLFKKLSLGLTFILKYDQNPAPRPIPAGSPAGASYPDGASYAFADKVDTQTEVTLMYTFF
jgi:hypothetical protein